MSCGTEHNLENNDYKHLCSLQYEDTIPLNIYKSQTTGITVCIAEVEATETFDNDGLPCAVALLILTGTQEIPSYTTFDFLAKKSLVNVINPHIRPDRTCFTMTAAGSEGFLNMMSIYLDYIFCPTLKDSAYLSEIHNVTSKGNAGDLYCNAQSNERTSHYIIKKEMLEKLYPGKCGYKSVIRGTTENLRKSTSIEKVKQFHQKFYRLENLTILITGKIKHNEIFQALLPLEKKISLKAREDFIRPWQTPIQQLTESVVKDVNFPSSDETYGMVYVAWRGPSPVTQVYDYLVCRLFLRYCEMIKFNRLLEDCSERSDISCICYTYDWSDSVLTIKCMNVPVQHIQSITKDSILSVLCKILFYDLSMETISTIIDQTICQYKLALEKDPHTKIVSAVCNHIIHGNIHDGQYEQYLDQSLNHIRELEKLKNEGGMFFVQQFGKYFIEAPMVIVKGEPSSEKYWKLEDEEQHITAEQITKLSENVLQENKKQLQIAINEKNSYFPPVELLAKVPIPGTESITFHHIKSYNTEDDKQHSKLDVKKLPLFTYLDDVKTNFVYLQVIMDTSSINTKYKPYILLLMDVLKRSPVKRNNQLLPYEEIVAPLDIISLKFGANTNNIGNHCCSMSLTLQVEIKKYEDSVRLCKELLCNTELTVDNLKISTTRLIDNNKHLDATDILDALLQKLLYKENCTSILWNKCGLLFFFGVVKKSLDTEAGQKNVIEEIEAVRHLLTLPKNMFVHMAVDVKKLTEQVSDVYAPWNKFFPEFATSEKTKPNLIDDWKLPKSFAILPFDGYIMGKERIESSFFAQACPCITNAHDPDLPALIVCLKYFTDVEGPVQQELKEKALSDNFYFRVSVNDGLLHLGFVPAENLKDAYRTVKEIVKTYSAEMEWDQHLYEKAKSMAILDCVDNVRSIKRMTKLSVNYSCDEVPCKYVYDDAQRICAVTMKDVIRVTTTHVKPLFDPKKSKTAIVCNISKVAEIEETFRIMNFDLKVCESLLELCLNN